MRPHARRTPFRMKYQLGNVLIGIAATHRPYDRDAVADWLRDGWF